MNYAGSFLTAIFLSGCSFQNFGDYTLADDVIKQTQLSPSAAAAAVDGIIKDALVEASCPWYGRWRRRLTEDQWRRFKSRCALPQILTSSNETTTTTPTPQCDAGFILCPEARRKRRRSMRADKEEEEEEENEDEDEEAYEDEHVDEEDEKEEDNE